MKQITQNLKTGEIKIQDVPAPVLEKGSLLVKNYFSLISAGTEKAKLEMGEKNIIQKALSRPDLSKQVLLKIRQDGLFPTLNKVMTKLESYVPLGYSCSGEILKIGENVTSFNISDRVACAGAGFANHSEIVSVPLNLVVKIPSGADFEDGAFTTLGAIAMQGIRQADVKIGENICVIGLGLLGQVSVQILNSCGCNVFGIDLDENKVKLSERLGAKKSLLRDSDIVTASYNFTDGFGFDSIIITAAASSNDPLITAGQIARDKAKIVVVGNVKIEIPRKDYYEKELQLLLSRSYGPGRYDRLYEKNGIDYPIGYVRWTEKRNMESFLELVAKKKVVLKPLISHRFKFNDATTAYKLLSGEQNEPYLGILLEYDNNKIEPGQEIFGEKISLKNRPDILKAGLIGAGNFACGVILPILTKNKDIQLISVCSASGLSAQNAVQRFKFKKAVESPEQILNDKEIDLIFIATTHQLHADLTAQSLDAGKAVFVEKPLAITKEGLKKVMKAAEKNPALMLGFNRRFSSHSAFLKRILKKCSGTSIFNYRVNALKIPGESWIHDINLGGGRIIGEVCHFIDLIQFLSDEKVSRVYASGIGNNDPDAKFQDNIIINLKLSKGSAGSIVYTSKGNALSGKEQLEIFCDGISLKIDDFRESRIFINGKKKSFKTLGQDKGHKNELESFVNAVKKSLPMPIAIEEIYNTTQSTFSIIDALKNDCPINVDE